MLGCLLVAGGVSVGKCFSVGVSVDFFLLFIMGVSLGTSFGVLVFSAFSAVSVADGLVAVDLVPEAGESALVFLEDLFDEIG